MAVRDLKPEVTLVDSNAQRFAARMTRGSRLGVLRMPFLEDAWGGMKAGQPELVLEAMLSILDNAILVYLAYRDVEIPERMHPIEALTEFNPSLGMKAWQLASEPAGDAEQIGGRLRRVMHFVEFELELMGPVPSWAGGVTEEEYLQYRNEVVYPAILLAQSLGALQLFPVPATYLEAALQAQEAGEVRL